MESNKNLIKTSLYIIVYGLVTCGPLFALADDEQIAKPEAAKASVPSPSDVESDRVFYQGLGDSCEIEMEANVKTQALKKDLNGLVGINKFSACSKALAQNCKEDLREVRKTLVEKGHFISDPEGEPIFPWTQGQAHLYLDVLVTKICSGSIAFKTVKSLDAIFFSNTTCTGEAFLNELPQFEALNFGRFDGTNECNPGFTGEASSGNAHANYMVLGGDNRTSDIFKPDGKVLNSLDDTLVHEFTHRKEMIDSKFAKDASEFIDMRFDRIQKVYSVIDKGFISNFNVLIHGVGADTSLSDEQKTLKVRQGTERLSVPVRVKLSEEKIPIRKGLGSDNGMMIGEAKGEPNSAQLGDGFTSVDGKLAGRGHSAIMLDYYMMTNPKEYLACAASMYRYDRNSAQKMFSPEELTWLKNHDGN